MPECGDALAAELRGQRREIGEQIKGAFGLLNFNAGLLNAFGDPVACECQNAALMREVIAGGLVPDIGLAGGMLNGGRGAGRSFRRDRQHGFLEFAVERFRQYCDAEPPAAGPAPIGKAAGRDRAFRIFQRERVMLAFMMQQAVNFIRQHRMTLCLRNTAVRARSSSWV